MRSLSSLASTLFNYRRRSDDSYRQLRGGAWMTFCPVCSSVSAASLTLFPTTTRGRGTLAIDSTKGRPIALLLTNTILLFLATQPCPLSLP